MFGAGVINKPLFKEKVVICRETLREVSGCDAVVNFCVPNVFSGVEWFNELHELAGPELDKACYRFRGMCVSSSRATGPYNATNFKKIIHTLVPDKLNLDESELHNQIVYLCYRNSLDLAVEEGCKTIAFPATFMDIPLDQSCILVLKSFNTWLNESGYADDLSEIRVICDQDDKFDAFVVAAKYLYSQAAEEQAEASRQAMRRNLPPRQARRSYESGSYANTPGYGRNWDDPNMHMGKPHEMSGQMGEQYDLIQPVLELELSAKLAPTLLCLDDENGGKRQYRLTNKSSDGRKLYFRCSRCDTVVKRDPTGNRTRAKLIIKDGVIVGSPYPQHHPLCQPLTAEEIQIQQCDRESRKDVIEGVLSPQQAYQKALARSDKFPDWSRVRQQYFRLRKVAIERQRQRQSENAEYTIMQPYDDQDQYIAVEDEEWREYESTSAPPDAKRPRDESMEPDVEYGQPPQVQHAHAEQIQAQQGAQQVVLQQGDQTPPSIESTHKMELRRSSRQRKPVKTDEEDVFVNVDDDPRVPTTSTAR